MYDFIVIGGGPAGSSASAHLAKNGAKVLVLEKKDEIGTPIQCGEGISLYELERIGMREGEHIVRMVDDVQLVFSTGSLFVRQRMASISRNVFDKTLAEKAVSEGAIFNMKHPVMSIMRKENGWMLSTRNGNYSTRYIIGADGYSSLLRRTLFPGIKADIIAGTSARGIVKGISTFRFYFSQEYPHGYAYLFPRDGDSVNAGVVLKGRKIHAVHRDFLKSAGVGSVHNRGGAIPFLIRPAAFHGWRSMLVGDAAGLANSITYGGIYAAVMSGKMAAEAGISALERDISYPRNYDSMLKNSDFFQKDPVKEHRMVYGMSAEEMEILGSIASDRYMDEIDLDRSFLKLIKGHPAMIPRVIRLYRYFTRKANVL